MAFDQFKESIVNISIIWKAVQKSRPVSQILYWLDP